MPKDTTLPQLTEPTAVAFATTKGGPSVQARPTKEGPADVVALVKVSHADIEDSPEVFTYELY